MRTANPALSEETFTRVTVPSVGAERMSVSGAVNRTAILLVLLVISAGFVWAQFVGAAEPSGVLPYILVGALGGLAVAILTIFKKEWSPYTSPVYAVLEGLAIGGISILAETQFPGIVIQAVGLTFGVLAVLLFAYRAGIIKVTEKFRTGVIAATGAILLVYVATFVLGFFEVGIPYIHGSGPIGIIFSIVVVVVAALNLVLDFDFIETGAERGAPRYMEWYAAFGLVVTLVWLYLEILRLLSKIRSR